MKMADIFSELELPMIRSRVKCGMSNENAKGFNIGRKPTTKQDVLAVFHKHYPAYAAKKMNVR